MMKRLTYIILVVLLTVAQAMAQPGYVVDQVCINANRTYRVNGEAGATYEWLLRDSGGNAVPLANSAGTPFTGTDPVSGNPVQGSEITIGWNNLGTYNLSVVETSVHGCDTLQQGTINVFDQPVADAGSPATICPGNSHTFTDARAFNYTTLWWTTSGDGSFDDPSRLDATYTPGPADRLSGEITCTLTVQGLGSGTSCTPAVSQVKLSVLQLEARVTATDITCFGANDGTLTISNQAGGSGSYEFSIDGVGWAATTAYSNLRPGTYTVLMRDAIDLNCIAIAGTAEIKEPLPLTASHTQTDATCLGNDGTISVINPGGGSGSYEYSINGTVWTTSGYFAGLAPGSYTILMRDANVTDCQATVGNAIIDMPAPVFAELDHTDVSCYGGTDGTITIDNAVNGSGNYEYSINGSAWLADDNDKKLQVKGLAAGKYSIRMRDANAPACIETLGDITILQPDELMATLLVADVSCFGSSDGSIRFNNPSGGSGNYKYSADGFSWYDTGFIGGLAPGTYHPYLVDADVPGCLKDFGEVKINEPLPLQADVSSTGISCYGANDGTITVSNPKNYQGSYVFSIDGVYWTSNGFFSGLAPRTYIVSMRDEKNCTRDISTLEIIEPKPLDADVASTNATCLGNDGTITITNPQNSVSGLYEFTIDGTNWTSNGEFTGLTPGTFYVQIRDASLVTCTRMLKIVEISEPGPLYAEAGKTDVTCYGGSNGTISVRDAKGGSGVYDFSIDGATWSTSFMFENLPAGSYNLTMRDSKAPACTYFVGKLDIGQPDKLEAVAVASPVTCFGGSDGTISLSQAKGGSGGYEYTVNGTDWFSDKIENLPAATYTVRMRDAADVTCTVALAPVTVSEPPAIAATLTPFGVSCFGGNDGRIEASNIQNATAPYELSVDGGATWTAGTSVSGLAEGKYNVTIRDARRCEVVFSNIEISQPDLLEAKVVRTNETSSGANDGTITVIAPQGGSGNFEYSLDAVVWQLSPAFAGLAPQAYEVWVRDANAPGCMISIPAIVLPAGAILAEPVPGNVTCYNGNNGSITFTNQSGATHYEYSIDGGATWQGSPDFTGLTAQPYVLMIRDADNRSNVTNLGTIDLRQPTEITATITRINESYPGEGGTIIISLVSGGTGPGYLFSVDGSPWTPTTSYSGLTVGEHIIRIKDSANCEIERTVILQPAGSISAEVAHTDVTCNGAGNGEITISGESGGSGVFEYSNDGGLTWQPVGTFNHLAPGTYGVMIRDRNNPANQAQLDKIVITEPGELKLTWGMVPPLCAGNSATVTIYASGGTSPYSGTGTYILAPGEKRTFRVTDANNCSAELVLTAPNPEKIVATREVHAPLCYGEDGTVTIKATGGTGMYENTGTFNVKAGAPFSFVVKDSNGCLSNVVSGTMPFAPDEIKVSVELLSSGCSGAATVSVTATGGNAPYAGTGTFTATNGLNVFTVTDANNCSATGSITVTLQDPPPAPVASLVQPNCYVPTGTIEITSPAGANYQYSLDGGLYQGSPVFAGLAPETSHIVRVKDTTTGCESGIAAFAIDPMPAGPEKPVGQVAQAPTCNDPNGTVEVVSPTGSQYAYSLNGGPFQASSVFNDLKTGIYTITVRDINTGCESASEVSVPAIPPAPTIAATSVNPKCFGDPGVISFAFTNVPDGTYAITYDGGQFDGVAVARGKAVVNALGGVYNNLSIEANGCSSDDDVDVTIIQPAEIVITIVRQTGVDLKNLHDGSIDIEVSGGTPFVMPDGTKYYLYKWSTGETTQDIKNLSAGDYTVTVTDAYGCTQKRIATIPQPNYPPVANPDEFTTACGAVHGSVVLNDTDPEGDPFEVDPEPVIFPLHGSLNLNPDGTFEYMADREFEGDDTFQYVIFDSADRILSSTAVVVIHVILDTDCDGIPNKDDIDDDDDGILDVVEGDMNIDTDGDGIQDSIDIDSDNDGIPDNIEWQTTNGYIPPKGVDSDGDGWDDAYDHDQVKYPPSNPPAVYDYDQDGIPDYRDTDSDNDNVPDYIEGYDANADGVADVLPSGEDLDNDGLDDAYDTVDRYTESGNATGAEAPLQDFDGDGDRDWRDINDDNDQWLTKYEDLNNDGDYSNDDLDFDGHPEYLDLPNECDILIPEGFSPNGDNVHDYFQIYCIFPYPEAHMMIFDQNGRKLYDKHHYGNLDYWGNYEDAWWNGTIELVPSKRGQKVPAGTYFYVLNLGNGEVKKSFVFVSYQ
jgi:gliding motility-associated-like protein